LLAVPSSALAGPKQTEPIKVYVFRTGSPGGALAGDIGRRGDSMDEVKVDLSSSKNPVLQIVETPQDADVTLRVLACGSKQPGSMSVAVKLSSGDISTVIEGTTNSPHNIVVGYSDLCRRAANNVSKDIERWIEANHDRLISRRAYVRLVADQHAACTPDQRTSACREAFTRTMEARIQKTAPGAAASVDGLDDDILVFQWQALFDDPKIRTAEEQKKNAENFCGYGFKRVRVVGSSNAAKYEFELNCPAELHTTTTQ
jgi:hypothetical protein